VWQPFRAEKMDEGNIQPLQFFVLQIQKVLPVGHACLTR
jgi:hypothetical protein